MGKLTVGIAGGLVLACLALQAPAAERPSLRGLVFSCEPEVAPIFREQAQQYFSDLGVNESVFRIEQTQSEVSVQLTKGLAQVSPLDFHLQLELGLADEMVSLPRANGELKAVPAVSKKEIALALMHPGRVTRFPCSIESLQEDIGVRQNIVAWAERLSWGWPEGGPAKWNSKYWKSGVPKASVVEALNDAFMNQEKYAIGCYAATKMVVAQGVLDYYNRVSPNSAKLAAALVSLESDNDLLTNIDPPGMWFFEDGFQIEQRHVPGKLFVLNEQVEPGNFVPGDWAYILNTDPVTYQKTGYEGSNAIYLGRGKFDDYYADHSHAYTYRQKLNEVYQWRNGVFSRTRDAHKVVPLTEQDFQRLSKTPEAGGLVLGYRAVPRAFGSQR